jgi:hypothetical protein
MIPATLALLAALAAAETPAPAPSPAPAPAPNPASPAAPPAPAPAPEPLFAPGERMEFSIHYLGVKMGAARISVLAPEGGVLPVALQFKTGGLVGFLDVRQQMVSYLDGASGLPRSSTIDAVELGYRHADSTRFDREANKATVRSKGKSESVDTVEMPPGTLDFVAMVFRLRRLPLGEGARHSFQVLSGTKVTEIVAEVVGREPVETDAGTFPAVKVRVPTGFTGKFSEKNPTFLWLSDDERRIVVRISTDFSIGRALATLVAYQPGK